MLVVFDCDGVLVDSEPLSNAALAEALTAHGMPIAPDEATREFMGRSWASCEAHVARLFGRPPPPELQFEPADSVVVEDSPLGVAAARAAGMTVVGLTARTPRERLAAADVVVAAMHDVPAAVGAAGPATRPGCAPR